MFSRLWIGGTGEEEAWNLAQNCRRVQAVLELSVSRHSFGENLVIGGWELMCVGMYRIWTEQQTLLFDFSGLPHSLSTRDNEMSSILSLHNSVHYIVSGLVSVATWSVSSTILSGEIVHSNLRLIIKCLPGYRFDCLVSAVSTSPAGLHHWDWLTSESRRGRTVSEMTDGGIAVGNR